MAEVKPLPRPDTPTALAAEAAPVALAAADPAPPETAPEAPPLPQPELVVTDPGPEVTPETTEVALADVTSVETVAAAPPPPAELLPEVAVLPPAAPRAAPIFDAVAVAAPDPEPVQEVVVMSTSGGRHFGVHVGEYPSRYDAERALLKTALAESATLNDSLRKTTQTGGAWRASFMGLTEDQADLACRRLRARAVPCETVGG